jgi:hypothetical protein
MSTRASIVMTDRFGDEIYFYRHSDGYPEETFEDLKKFVEGYNGKYRNSAEQSAGWLVIYGYLQNLEYYRLHPEFEQYDSWKSGIYEIATGIHGDAEWVYWIDLKERILKCYQYCSSYFKDYSGRVPFKEYKIITSGQGAIY